MSDASEHKMKIFNKQSKCPKCGFSGVSAHYFAKAGEHESARIFGNESHWPRCEFIRRTCKQCLYAWAERCRS